jgi:lysophospholipase L1-like esterase
VRRLVVRLAVVAPAFALTLVVGLQPAVAAGISYAALGDSYSSGVGAGSYIAASGSCERSTKAYPQLWANTHSPASFVFAACSGAKTGDVIANQLGGLNAATTLVTISVGGNDVGFSTVMTNCVLYSTATCVSDVDAAENQARTVLPAKLDAVYSAIRAHAPNARVVVLDYPRLYHVGVWYCIGLSDTARSKINEGADVLDGVIATEAAKYGFSFADVRPAFAAGHEICDSNSWLHSVDWSDLEQSYHPTAAGQAGGYLPALTAVTG